MKNRLFDKKLFFQGLLQLKTIGIVQTVLTVVGSLIVLFIYAGSLIISGEVEPRVVGHIIMAAPMISLIYLFVPIMSLNIFGFTNKRNESDFYHSLYHTRECICLSFAAAVAAWTAFTVLVTSLVSVIGYSVFPSLFIIKYSTILPMMLNIITGGMLVTAAVVIASSVTGTALSKLITMLMVLFVPRIFTSIMVFCARISLDYLVADKYMQWLNNGYNVVVGGATNMYGSYGSALYTFLLAAVYMVIGTILFKHRRSEAAASSAASRPLQALLRIVFTMLFCLPSIVIIYLSSNPSYNFGYEPGVIIYIIALYVVALVVYFIFELVTMRTPKNLLKIIPGLIIVVLLNGAIIGSMFGMRASAQGFCPRADEISGVSVKLLSGYDYDLSNDFLGSASFKVDIKDGEVKQILSESLEYAINNQDQDEYYSRDVSVIARFKVGMRAEYRHMRMTKKDANKLIGELAKNREFSNAFATLPEYDGITDLSVDCFGDYYDNADVGISAQEKKQFYSLLREDYAAADLAELYKYLMDFGGEYYEYHKGFARVRVQVVKNEEYNSIMMPIGQITPQGTKYLAELLNTRSEPDKDRIRVLLEQEQDGGMFQVETYDFTTGVKDSYGDYRAIGNCLDNAVNEAGDETVLVSIVYDNSWAEDFDYNGEAERYVGCWILNASDVRAITAKY